MNGTRINIEKANELYNKMGLRNGELTVNGLISILSFNLTELETDLFNCGEWDKVQKITDLIEVYDQTGIILTEFDESLY